VASTKQQQSASVKSGVAVIASTSSSVNPPVFSRSSTSAAGPSYYQSPQSDNSFDAEYCDVEPDSSPGSVTNGDVADVLSSAAVATAVVSDTFSSSSIVQAWLGSTEAASSLVQHSVTAEASRPSIVVSDGVLHSTLPIFSSTTIADLPKSSFAVTFDKFPSPVKYNTDLFGPVLPPLATYSLTDYTAPVMVAESSARCPRFLPATAAALCDTSTVSSPSFARSLCAAVCTAAKRRHLEPTVSESNVLDRQACGTSMPSFVSGLAQHSTVVSSSTPVMADVLQAQLDQGSINQLSAAGLPVMRTAVDHAVLNALLSQTQLGIPKTEALAAAVGRQQALPNDLTVPVIAFLNLGSGTGSLPSFSCAEVLPPGALQFLKMSVSHESNNTSSQTSSLVSSADQAKLF